jgi:hypothetical protein
MLPVRFLRKAPADSVEVVLHERRGVRATLSGLKKVKQRQMSLRAAPALTTTERR